MGESGLRAFVAFFELDFIWGCKGAKPLVPEADPPLADLPLPKGVALKEAKKVLWPSSLTEKLCMANL